jgi:hypothetical protein
MLVAWSFAVGLGVLGCQDPGASGSKPQAKDIDSAEWLFALEAVDNLERCFFVTKTREYSTEFLSINKRPLIRVGGVSPVSGSYGPWLAVLWRSGSAEELSTQSEFQVVLTADKTPHRVKEALNRLVQAGHLRETPGECTAALRTHFEDDVTEGIALMAAGKKRWGFQALLCVACALNSSGMDLGESLRRWRNSQVRNGNSPIVRPFDFTDAP